MNEKSQSAGDEGVVMVDMSTMPEPTKVRNSPQLELIQALGRLIEMTPESRKVKVIDYLFDAKILG